jgi:hypothetical protein
VSYNKWNPLSSKFSTILTKIEYFKYKIRVGELVKEVAISEIMQRWHVYCHCDICKEAVIT